MDHVSWIAVVACGIASLVLGGLWYSPLLFNKIWMREAGVTADMAKGMNMPLVMGGTLVIGLAAGFVLAMLAGSAPGLANGVSYGFHAGLFFVAGATGINYMWSRKSFKLFLIDGGYQVVQFMLYGVLIGWLQ